MSYCVLLITTPNFKISKKIAQELVRKKIAACVNIIPKISSIYFWEDKICQDKECLLVIKTKLSNFSKLEKEVKKIHPYKVPEIIALQIKKGNVKYLKWIDSVIAGDLYVTDEKKS